MVRDFSPGNTFVWSPQQEGPYQIMVRVKDSLDATDAISASVPVTREFAVAGTTAEIASVASRLSLTLTMIW